MTASKVAFVCQWYPPEPALQPLWIASGLADAGAQVSVLTGIPNYPSGVVAPGYRASRVRTEQSGRVLVRRTPVYPSHDSSVVRRFLNYASWAVSATVFGQSILRRADVALVYSSPATAALPAMVAKALWGTPFVLLVQDVWPDSVFSSGFLNGRLASVARRAIDVFVQRAYSMAEHVAVISPGMVDLLAARGVPRSKLSVIYNWVAEEVDEPDATHRLAVRESLGLMDRDFVVMYAGNHGRAQGLGDIIKGFGLLTDSERCHLVLVGQGAEKADLIKLAVGQPNVHFVDPQPREAMPSLRAAADVQLVSLVDNPLFEVTMPSKLQAILAAGQPVLVSGRGDVVAVVNAAAAGLATVPSPSAVASAVRALAGLTPDDRAAMGARGREFYAHVMSREVGLPALKATLDRASNHRRTKSDGRIHQ